MSHGTTHSNDMENDRHEGSADGDEALLDEDEGLEEGTERCPFCGSWFLPGSGDECAHFIGLVWETEIIWTNDYDAFTSAHYDLSEVLSDLETGCGEAGLRELRRRAAWIPKVQGMIASALHANGPLLALEELAEFVSGDSIRTDGMLGGSRAAAFHSNPRVIRDWTERYIELTAVAKSVLNEADAAREPS